MSRQIPSALCRIYSKVRASSKLSTHGHHCMSFHLKSQALPKQEAKLRDALVAHFAYLDKSVGKKDVVIDESLAHLIDKDYSPVVMFAVNTIV